MPDDPKEEAPKPLTPPEKGGKTPKATPPASPASPGKSPKLKTPKGKMKDKLKAAAVDVYGHNQQIRDVFDSPVSGEEQEKKEETKDKKKEKKQLGCNAGLPGYGKVPEKKEVKKPKVFKKNPKLTKEEMVAEKEQDKELKVFIEKFNEDSECEKQSRKLYLKSLT